MKDDYSIQGKCIACYDTGVINKGTEVEEKCPICGGVQNEHLQAPDTENR
jgi:rubrerythrin